MWERLRGTAACWESVGAVGWWGTWRGLLWGEKAADGQKEKDEMALVNSAAGQITGNRLFQLVPGHPQSCVLDYVYNKLGPGRLLSPVIVLSEPPFKKVGRSQSQRKLQLLTRRLLSSAYTHF